MIIGIDPGPDVCHAVWWDEVDRCVTGTRSEYPAELAALADFPGYRVAIEDFISYNQRLGASSIDTIKNVGKLELLIPHATLINRRQIKKHLCGKETGVGDPEVNKAVRLRYWSSAREAIGRKKAPGPLYGVAGHYWAALAVAIVCAERE